MQSFSLSAPSVNSDRFALAYSPPSDAIQSLPKRLRPIARLIARPTWTREEMQRVEGYIYDKLDAFLEDDYRGREIRAIADPLIDQFDAMVKSFNASSKAPYDAIMPWKPVEKPSAPSMPALPVRILKVLPVDMLEGARGAYQRRGESAISEHWDNLGEEDRKKVGNLLIKLGFGKLTRKHTAFARFSEAVRNEPKSSPVCFPPAETSFEPIEVPEHLEYPAPIGIMVEGVPILPEPISGGSHDATIEPATNYCETLGMLAYARGIQSAPCQDPDMMARLVGRPIGNNLTIPELEAWQVGWFKAHSAATMIPPVSGGSPEAPLIDFSEVSGDLPDWSTGVSLEAYPYIADFDLADDDSEDDDFVEVTTPETLPELVARFAGWMLSIVDMGRFDRTEWSLYRSARDAWEAMDDEQMGSILRMITELGYPRTTSARYPDHWQSDFDRFMRFIELCETGSAIRFPVPPISPDDLRRMESVAESTLTPAPEFSQSTQASENASGCSLVATSDNGTADSTSDAEVSPERRTGDPGTITIGATTYGLTILTDAFDLCKASGECHRVTIEADGSASCDCPSSRFREVEVCKHRRRLAELGLLPDWTDRLLGKLNPAEGASEFLEGDAMSQPESIFDAYSRDIAAFRAEHPEWTDVIKGLVCECDECEARDLQFREAFRAWVREQTARRQLEAMGIPLVSGGAPENDPLDRVQGEQDRQLDECIAAIKELKTINADLLAACEEVIRMLGKDSPSYKAGEMALKAIAKAKGVS